MEEMEAVTSERWRNGEGEREESDASRTNVAFPEQLNDFSAEAQFEDVYSNDVHADPDPSQSQSSYASSVSCNDADSEADTYQACNPDEQSSTSEQWDDDPEFDQDISSPLAYARHYGLTTCYKTVNPFKAVEYPSPSITKADLNDPDSVPTIDEILDKHAFLQLNEPERLNIDRDTAVFLASVFSLEKTGEPLESLLHSNTPLYSRNLKIEEPVLTSDPELDLWRLRRLNAAIVSSKGMEAFELDDEKGEGFGWSIEEKRAHTETEELIASEKLDIDVELLTYLKDEILVFCKVTTNDDIVGACLDDCPIRLPQPISPPLLPISPPLSPAPPSTAAMAMEFTSSPVDLVTLEAVRLEQQILGQDNAPSSDLASNQAHFFDTSFDPRSLYSSLCTPQDTSSSPSQRTGIRNLEVDVPLIPEEPADTPQKKTKTVSFPPELHTMIPTSDADIRTSDQEREFDSFVKNIVMPFAEPVIQAANHERLSEFDTTMRIPVPSVERVELKAPWMRSKNESNPHEKLLSGTKTSLGDSDKKWSGVSKVERLLLWSPFPIRLGKVQTDETFDDGSLARYMAEITFEDRIDFEGLVWKPEGLRILDGLESDNEELECMEDHEQVELSGNIVKPVSHSDLSAALQQGSNSASTTDRSNDSKPGPGTVDMQTLLRKRKLELERGKDSLWPNKLPDRYITTQSNMAAENDKTIAAGIAGGMSAFMRLHGDDLKATNTASKPRGQTLQQFAPPAVMVLPEPRTQPANVPAPLPTPKILDPEGHKAVVLSSDLAKNRGLLRFVLRALPQLQTIEREALASPDTNGQLNIKQADRFEADITLSAGTGIIITTLQQLRQKPLPGQLNFFGVRDRIQSVAIRYEQVHVLINEARLNVDGDLNTTSPLDQQDAEALSDLAGLATTPHTDVDVRYVAGGEVELAQWLAALISRYATSDISLLQEETLWERFLRYAGLNAYASQAILGQLKRIESHTTEMSSSSVEALTLPPYGLAAFIQMAGDERVERFGPMMGGDRVLRRVNEVVDGQWISAAIKKRK